MSRITSLFLAIVTALGLSTGSARAQTGPVNNTTPVQQPVSAQMNLPQILQNLGHNPKEVKQPNGDSAWIMNINKDGWNYEITASLAKFKNGKVYGYFLTARLRPATLSASEAVKILEKNHLIRPYVITYAQGQLFMSVEVPFVQDQQGVADELKFFMKQIQETYSVWGGQAAPVAPTPVNNNVLPASIVPPVSSLDPSIPQQGLVIQGVNVAGIDS